MSLTHGSPRQHIWTFASGATDSNPTASWVCPCDASINISSYSSINFVGGDYFCETGIHETWMSHYIFHPNDPLWDGEGCSSSSSCCSLHDPPYFVKQLSTPTTDDIEARICLEDRLPDEDIAIELVELYVQ